MDGRGDRWWRRSAGWAVAMVAMAALAVSGAAAVASAAPGATGAQAEGAVAGPTAASAETARRADRRPTQEAERHAVPGRRVVLHNVVGEVRLEPGTGPDVVVTVSRGGADGHRLAVERDRRGEAGVLRIVYPEDEVVYPRLGRRSRSSFRQRAESGPGGRERRMTVRGSGSGLEAWADLTVAVPPGKEVALHHGMGSVAIEGVEAELRIDAAAARVEARGTRGALFIDTGSGSVAVRSAEGGLRVDTGSGRVTLEAVRGEALNVDTGSGGVVGSDLHADQLRVDTGSGRIRLARVSARDLRLDTGSGGVELELLSDIRSAEIESGSGSVTLRVPPELGARLEVRTGSGGIDFELPVTVSRVRRNHLQGTLGDGDGHLRIDTGSGRVRLLGVGG